MGLFYRWRKPPPADWAPGTATIRVSQPHGAPGYRDSGGGIFDIELNHFGYRMHTFSLEVSTDVHGTYRVMGDFKVPRRAENTGWLAPNVQVGLKPGLRLPIHVDPRDREAIRIDWVAFLDSPTRKREQKEADEAHHLRRVAEASEPKLEDLD